MPTNTPAEFTEEERITLSSTPTSKIVCAMTEQDNTRMRVGLLESLREAGLTDQQIEEAEQRAVTKEGINTGTLYAYLISLPQFSGERADERASELSEKVRQSCLGALTDPPPANMPPPPNTVSGEHRLNVATPRVGPLKKPFDPGKK